MNKQLMVCGVNCHKGAINCNNYCGHDLTKPMPDKPNEATPEMVLETKKEAAHKLLREATKAWHEYAKECEMGEEREYAFDVYERVRTASRVQ